MAIYLLDTSVIIDTLNGNRNRPALLSDLINRGHELACCAVNVTEIYAGMRPKEEQYTTAFLRSLHFYPIQWSVAELAGRLKREYSRKGKMLGIADATIAAVALFHSLPLLTDNVKDFPMKDLQIHSFEE